MFFQRSSKPSTPATPLSAAQLQEELITVEASADQIAARLADAQAEQAETQRQYDAAMQEFAINQKGVAPNREPLQAALAKIDALRRIHATNIARVAELQSAAASAAVAEAAADSQQQLDAMTAVADVKLAELESAIIAVRMAEQAYFDVLYGKGGLKQHPSGLQEPQIKARWALARRAIKIAERHGYLLRRSFEVDGNPHWEDFRRQVAFEHAIRNASWPRDASELGERTSDPELVSGFSRADRAAAALASAQE